MQSHFWGGEIFTENHAFISYSPYWASPRRLYQGNKNSMRCLGSEGKEPVGERITENSCSSCGFFEKSKHWALSSPHFIVHCWRKLNFDVSVFVTCMIFKGFSIITQHQTQYRSQSTAGCVWSGSTYLSQRFRELKRGFTLFLYKSALTDLLQ